MTFSVHVPDEAAMLSLAKSVARYANCGDVITLKGTLGMGKSTFARGFVRALAEDDDLVVPSPTFTLVQHYEKTRLPLAHVDAYRMASSEEIYALDLEDFFDHGIVLIEWPENVEETLPERETVYRYPMESDFGARLDIDIVEDSSTGRVLHLTGGGSWFQRMGLIFPEQCLRTVSVEGRKAFLSAVSVDGEEIALSPDCSFRQYFRVSTEKGMRLVMDAPEPIDHVKTFVEVASVLENRGVRVPKIYASDVEKGYLLLEDFGDISLRQVLTEGSQSEAWLAATIDLLADIANQGAASVPCGYGPSALWQEAQRYTDWYLPAQNGHATAVEDRKVLQKLFYQLYPHVSKLPKVFTHWDFHIDNLMLLKDIPAQENIGVIDFQDARCAPLSMDIACLLEDRLPVSDELKEKMIQRFLQKLETPVDEDAFKAAYAISITHRFLKVLGLLERLERRDGRVNVKKRLPQVWAKLREVTQHDVLKDIRQFLIEMSPHEMKGE